MITLPNTFVDLIDMYNTVNYEAMDLENIKAMNIDDDEDVQRLIKKKKKKKKKRKKHRLKRIKVRNTSSLYEVCC